MMNRLLLPLALIACCAAAPAPTPSTSVTGDYVEARSASVFAGACHFNGELVTIGHEAVLAWNIRSGSWQGTNLAGVKAMAAIVSDENLRDEAAARKSEVVVDSSASPAQVSAFADFLRAQCGHELGTVVSVKQQRVNFDHSSSAYTVSAEHFASLSVEPMPNDECCSQPSLVWYSPFVKLEHRKVGYTKQASYRSGAVGDTWERAGENSAFYGAFTFTPASSPT